MCSSQRHSVTPWNQASILKWTMSSLSASDSLALSSTVGSWPLCYDGVRHQCPAFKGQSDRNTFQGDVILVMPHTKTNSNSQA